MSTDRNYLSDEELKRLIAETENDGLVQFPEHIRRKVLSLVEKKTPAKTRSQKTADFYKFTYKVVLAIAAALLLLVLAPGSFENAKRVPPKDEVLSERNRFRTIISSSEEKIPSREEAINEQKKDHIIDKIEVLISEKGGLLK